MNIVQSVDTHTAQFHVNETAEHRYQCSLSLKGGGGGGGGGFTTEILENTISR